MLSSCTVVGTKCSLHLLVLHHHLPTPSTHASRTTTYPLRLLVDLTPQPTHSLHLLGSAQPPTHSIHPWVLHNYLPIPSTPGSYTTTYPLPQLVDPALPPTHSLHPWVLHHHLPAPSPHGLHCHLPTPSTFGSCTTTYPLPPPTGPAPLHTRFIYPWIYHSPLS